MSIDEDIRWIQRGEIAPQGKIPLSLPKSIWQYLYNKGFQTEEEIKNLFSPSLTDLTQPFALDQMDLAIERLIVALKIKEKICIYADFDMDGTPGLALLKKGLELCGYKNLVYFQPKRLAHGYGIHKFAVEEFSEQGVGLIISVDVGITDVGAVQRAKDLGIDVIITDHHLEKENLPPALAIVNPNKKTDTSGLEHLCGAGVAFYVILALKMKLKELNLLKKDFSAKILLDCFTIGTLTDMVPIVKENRILIKHGLIVLKNTQRPGLRALMKEVGIGGKNLTSADVAIRFAPKLNALSRLETDLLPIDLFLEEDKDQAKVLVKGVLQRNNERIKLQAEAEEEAFELFNKTNQKNFIWVSSEKFHQGVVGLVATKLSQDFNRPAFIGAINSKGSITGSARLPPGDGGSLLLALNSAKDSLIRFGGHAPASGFEVSQESEKDFEEALSDYYRLLAENSQESLFQSVNYDSDLSLNEINHAYMDWLDHLSPFGQEFEAPTFRLKSLRFKSLRDLKGGHKKFTFIDESNKKKTRASSGEIDALWFSPPKNHPLIKYLNKKNLQSENFLDLIAEPQWNYFNGRQSIQLLIKDIKLT